MPNNDEVVTANRRNVRVKSMSHSRLRKGKNQTFLKEIVELKEKKNNILG